MSKTMDAIQFDPKKLKLSLVKTDMPTKVGPNDVLVEVAYSGVCGTDLHIVEGNFPCVPEPVILGHEFCGLAKEVGAEVTHIKKGDRVSVDPNSGCSACTDCSNGCYHYCKKGGLNKTVGIWRNGGWAQYCAVPSSQVYTLPDNITLEQAALTEPISCISHGWDRLVPVPIGSRVLVQGAGIIGNLWISVLHLQGHKQVTVSEPQQARRDFVSKLETGYACVSPDQLTAWHEADADWGFDLVIDCSGFAPAIERAVDYLKPGGRLCIFGVASPEARVSLSPYTVFKKELSVVGVLINQFSFPKALSLIDAMGGRYLAYEKLGIRVFSLAEYEDAMKALKKGIIAKAVFKVK